MARYSSRRRLGTSRGNYARTMGMRPLPFRRRKPTFSRTGLSAAPRLGRRVRPRMARSYTATRTKTKRRAPKITSHGDNQSASYNSIGKKWLTRFEKLIYKKVVSPQCYFKNSAYNATSTQGKQGYSMISRVLEQNELVTMKTAANGGTATDAPVKLYVKGCKVIMRVRNQTNTNAKVFLYDIVTKRAPPSTSYDTPIEAWSKGMQDYGATTAVTTVGISPTKSPEFNEYYGINRVTTLHLEPGQQHDHTVFHTYNRVIDSTRFDNSSAAALQGLTRFCLMVFHGTLVHDTAAANTVTYAPVSIDISTSYEYTYGWLETAKKTFSVTDNMPTTVVDTDHMGESGDMDVNVVSA